MHASHGGALRHSIATERQRGDHRRLICIRALNRTFQKFCIRQLLLEPPSSIALSTRLQVLRRSDAAKKQSNRANFRKCECKNVNVTVHG